MWIRYNNLMNSLPKISIVIPSFNQGEFIEETILSIISQEYPNLELIVIDGGSSDNTIDIIKKYENSIHYWISEKDNGQSHAINKGLKLATGQLHSFLNSDDLLMPNSLFEVAKAFSNNEKQIITATWREGFSIEKAITRQVLQPLTLDNFLLKEGLFGQPGTFWTASMQKHLMNEKLHFCMDFEFYYRLLNSHYTLKILDSPLGFFRVHSAAKSSTIQETKYEELVTFYTEIAPKHPQLKQELIAIANRNKRTLYRLQLLNILKNNPIKLFSKIWECIKYDPKVFIKGI